jgi:hypothetical protein
LNRVKWGSESAAAAGGGGNITIVIGRVESPYRQVESVVAEQVQVVEPEPMQPMQVSTVEEV